ncbi:hypothetical protein PFY01_01140 [Brevundimonas vesicularis]|uniref:hypothetical protein n=1 Tax=Brevundimonas vesicularis TaxID=41276 RepID=UPI0022EC5538|nr:hypothetical protein [Brevundimonas vesicularis]WBT06319.1 hypothetical protein PFY01_01140 [Brevundimonas vesicularis]
MSEFSTQSVGTVLPAECNRIGAVDPHFRQGVTESVAGTCEIGAGVFKLMYRSVAILAHIEQGLSARRIERMFV